MATISSAIGLQGVTQAAFQQLKLQQARQGADRAEQVARSLRIQAADAQREADRAQENARDLSARSVRAQGEAGRARQGVAMIQSVNALEAEFSTRLTHAVAAVHGAERSQAAPVVNTSGQLTGTTINTAV